MIHIATFFIALFAGTANPSATEIQGMTMSNDNVSTTIHAKTEDDGEDGGKEKGEGIGSGNLGGN